MTQETFPFQRHQWSDGSDPSTASRETVLFHDAQHKFGVVLFRRNFVKIFSENSAFEVVGKSEPHPRNRRRGSGGKHGGGDGGGRHFHFLSVQFKSVNPADVEVLIGEISSFSCHTVKFRSNGFQGNDQFCYNGCTVRESKNRLTGGKPYL